MSNFLNKTLTFFVCLAISYNPLFASKVIESPFLPKDPGFIEFENSIPTQDKNSTADVTVKVSAYLSQDSHKEERQWLQETIKEAKSNNAKIEYLVVGYQADEFIIEDSLRTLEEISGNRDTIKVEHADLTNSATAHIESSSTTHIKTASISFLISGSIVGLGVITTNAP